LISLSTPVSSGRTVPLKRFWAHTGKKNGMIIDNSDTLRRR
jgi:hypothetical protein